MHEVVLFAEDYAHEVVLTTLIERIGNDLTIPIRVRTYSATGGHGRAISELRAFANEIVQYQRGLPRLIVAVIDANCQGYNHRKREIEEAVPSSLRPFLIPVVPDPHIERWLLVDTSAFATAVGGGCDAPDMKCDRDRYKNLLGECVHAAGITPMIGGIEHAPEIVAAIDLKRAFTLDASLGRAIQDIRRGLQHI